MKYLLECTKQYISESHAHGETIWTSLQNSIIYVLTHPNDWGGPQQGQMRQAAIQAGLVPDTEDGRSRINFVTKGEANLHFCLSNGLALANTVRVFTDRNSTLWLTAILRQQQPGVLIVNAGEGTIDLMAYRRLPDHSFEEITVPKCVCRWSPCQFSVHALNALLQITSKGQCSSQCVPRNSSRVRFYDTWCSLTPLSHVC
jgi:hypothetical protein